MAQSADDIDAGLDAQDVDTAGELTEWLQSYSHLEILGAYGRRLIDLEGQSASAGGPNVSLVGSTSVGATSVTIDTVPDGLAVGTIIAIDAFTTECEIRTVTGLSAGTLTVAALRFAHASGDAIKVLSEAVPISLFGVTGSGSNEWATLQRLVLEAIPLKLKVDGYERAVSIAQPLVFPTSGHTSRIYVKAMSSFAPADVDGGAVTVANRTGSCTAAASTNTFTTPAAHGFSVDTQIVLSNPYGETLPGSIVGGRFYWVISTPTTTTFTISATQGGSVFDVTSDGTATYFQSLGTTTLVRVHWESFRLDLEANNVNGLMLALQQPSWTRNTRIEMSSVSSAAIGWFLTGQQSYHENLEVNTQPNCVGIQIEGTGHIVRGINCNGLGGTAVRITGSSNHISDLWTETMNVGCEIYGTANDIVIDGTWHGNMPDVNAPMLKVSNNVSYSVGMMKIQASGYLLIDDIARGFQYRSGTGGMADGQHVFGGLRQPYANDSSVGPILNDRQPVSTSSNVTADHLTGQLFVDAVGGAKTVTLPAMTGWKGWALTIVNSAYSGTNLVTVDPPGTEYLDGLQAGRTLLPGESITVVSDGAVWWSIGHVLPGGTSLATYAATNVTTDRAFDADTVAITELADVVGTLIADLRARRIVG